MSFIADFEAEASKLDGELKDKAMEVLSIFKSSAAKAESDLADAVAKVKTSKAYTLFEAIEPAILANIVATFNTVKVIA